MKDITFVIPVKIDSADRLNNLQTSIDFLLKYYNCHIIVKECDTFQKVFLPKNKNIFYFFEESKNNNFFHRTKILNDMLRLVETKYVANYDCDILIPQINVEKSIFLLDGGYDMVFPYEKGLVVLDWPLNEQQREKILSEPDTLYLEKLLEKHKCNHFVHDPSFSGLDVFKNIGLGKIFSAGSVQFFNTKSYIEGFGENEAFIDWGPEDQERLYRFFILGYKSNLIVK